MRKEVQIIDFVINHHKKNILNLFIFLFGFKYANS